jgi:hypothetical protein
MYALYLLHILYHVHVYKGVRQQCLYDSYTSIPQWNYMARHPLYTNNWLNRSNFNVNNSHLKFICFSVKQYEIRT